MILNEPPKQKQMGENLFDMTNFEQSLQEHADDFTIVPSPRVWQGIYNDMHPGKKWPSIPMTFMLLLTLLGIGYLNHSPINQVEKDINLNERNLSSALNTSPNTNKQLKVAYINKNYNSDNNDNQLTSSLKKVKISNENSPVNNELSHTPKIINDEVAVNAETPVQLINPINQQLSDASIKNEISANTENVELELNKESETINSPIAAIKKTAEEHKKSSSDIVQHLNKKTPKVNFSFFVTPTVSNAYFAGDDTKNIKTDGSLLTINPAMPRSTMIVNAQLGLRLGGQFEYHITPKLQLIIMGQASYSGYTIISNNEPLATGKLALKDKTGPVYSKTYVTNLGNGRSENQVPLKNYSVQLALPVGVQYEIWKNNSAAVFVSTAVGPSYVLMSNAHLLSSDGRNYVDDQSLMRKSNYTGFLGTHIEFRLKNAKWSIGPTVSYQLLSTYENKYPVKEHLLDYGIKIGISK